MIDDLLQDRLIPTKAITLDRRITDRGLRKQIASGRFPAPDANVNGRNYWRASTYLKWKTAALAGEFAKIRRPGRSATEHKDAGNK